MSNKTKGFTFTKEVCIGDVIQICIVLCSVVWLFAHIDERVNSFGRELDELHQNVGSMRSEMDTMKGRIEFFGAHR